MTISNRILLVESDANLSIVVADYLRSKSYIVETAKDGQDGVSLAQPRGIYAHSCALLLALYAGQCLRSGVLFAS